MQWWLKQETRKFNLRVVHNIKISVISGEYGAYSYLGYKSMFRYVKRVYGAKMTYLAISCIFNPFVRLRLRFSIASQRFSFFISVIQG